MKELYEMELEITPGNADASGRLSYHDAFRLFMDMAAMHAEVLGVGLQAMQSRDLFWLTVKTKIRFERRPVIGEKVVIRTWPEAPERIRCHRSYEIRSGEDVLVAGRTEWAVMNTRTHTVVPIRGVFPDGLQFPDGSALQEGFDRVPELFEERPFASCKVCSTDIDVGGHMNNTAYVRALIGCFSVAELQAMDAHVIEVIYRTPCFEGDILQVQKRQTEQGLLFRFSREGKTVLLGKMQ